MRSTLIAVLALIPTVAVAQVPEGENPNQYLKQQLEEDQMQMSPADMDTCVEVAEDVAYASKKGFEVESNTEDLYTVKIFEENNRVLRITCYKGQMFQEQWTQSTD